MLRRWVAFGRGFFRNPNRRGAAISVQALSTASAASLSTPVSVAILVADGFDEHQFCTAMKVFQGAGCAVRIVSPGAGLVTGAIADRSGHSFMIDQAAGAASADDFQALFVPGGAASIDRLAKDAEATALVAEIVAADKPVGVIGEGARLLDGGAEADGFVDAVQVRGRTVTAGEGSFGREAAERVLGLASA